VSGVTASNTSSLNGSTNASSCSIVFTFVSPVRPGILSGVGSSYAGHPCPQRSPTPDLQLTIAFIEDRRWSLEPLWSAVKTPKTGVFNNSPDAVF
jgi:hypothetical protein